MFRWSGVIYAIVSIDQKIILEITKKDMSCIRLCALRLILDRMQSVILPIIDKFQFQQINPLQNNVYKENLHAIRKCSQSKCCQYRWKLFSNRMTFQPIHCAENSQMEPANRTFNFLLTYACTTCKLKYFRTVREWNPIYHCPFCSRQTLFLEVN